MTNRIFALILLSIAGFCGGTLLVIDWRLLALSIVAGLSLLLGITVWRGTFEGLKIDTKRGFWRIKLHPAIILPIIFLAFGAAISGILIDAIR